METPTKLPTAPEVSEPEERPPGFMVIKMRPNEGIMVGEDVEIRLCSSRNNRADIAIRAHKSKRIKRMED